MAVKKWRKLSGCVINFYLKDSEFIAFKKDTKFLTRYVKGVPFVNSEYTKGTPSLSKWHIKV